MNPLSFFSEYLFTWKTSMYACCKKTCLPSFLKLMDGVFLQEIGVPSLDRAGANVTGKVPLIVYNGAKLTLNRR